MHGTGEIMGEVVPADASLGHPRLRATPSGLLTESEGRGPFGLSRVSRCRIIGSMVVLLGTSGAAAVEIPAPPSFSPGMKATYRVYNQEGAASEDLLLDSCSALADTVPVALDRIKVSPGSPPGSLFEVSIEARSIRGDTLQTTTVYRPWTGPSVEKQGVYPAAIFRPRPGGERDADLYLQRLRGPLQINIVSLVGTDKEGTEECQVRELGAVSTEHRLFQVELGGKDGERYPGFLRVWFADRLPFGFVAWHLVSENLSILVYLIEIERGEPRGDRELVVVGDRTDLAGTVVTGSPTVFLDGRPLARAGDRVRTAEGDEARIVARDDETVFVEGRRVARIGDRADDGSVLVQVAPTEPDRTGDAGTTTQEKDHD